ncbi:MAG TPA: gfo/Idh/MocA family oxidoreductase [Planctomycetaceae bacterium]|nr:gfo/Idh/MocA family oxidoreductase [Planctomycetaceae bacterium]
MSRNSQSSGRRQFLKQSVALSGLLGAPGVLRAANRHKQLNVAAVGVNGMGWSDLNNIGTHDGVHFAGFCDIDSSRFDKADAAYPGVKHWADYREMFDQLGTGFDAVIVSTPDHMHAPVAMAAMKMGKHVYCQKPLTHTVWEARQLNQMAAKAGVITQMGNQIHSAKEYRLGVRLIQDGAIGKVQAVHSWVGVQGRQYCQRTDRPAAAEVPAGVNWDLWLGAAQERPFAADVYHPFKWRDWQDFGSGALGDFGCHILDPVFTALGIRHPISIHAENSGTTSEVWPGPETVTWKFRGTKYTTGPIEVVWRDGGLKPPAELAGMPADRQLPAAGSLFIGEAGTMVLPHVGMPQLYPADRFADYKLPEVAGASHWHAWVDAVLAGQKTTDGFDYAGPLTETVQLGNVAARLPGMTIEWNAESFRTNLPAADRLLTKSYRGGFEVPGV